MTVYDILDKHYFSAGISFFLISLIALFLLCFKIGLIQYIVKGVKFICTKISKIGKNLLEHRKKMAELRVRKLTPGSICIDPDTLKSDKHKVFFDGTQRFKTFIKNGCVVKREEVSATVKGPLRTIQYKTRTLRGKDEVYIFIESGDPTDLRMINKEPYIVKKLDWKNDFQWCPDE